MWYLFLERSLVLFEEVLLEIKVTLRYLKGTRVITPSLFYLHSHIVLPAHSGKNPKINAHATKQNAHLFCNFRPRWMHGLD